MYWTLELASKLEDAPWPATKDELIDYAIRSGAPLEVLENLQEIEDEGDVYDSIESGPTIPRKKTFFSTRMSIKEISEVAPNATSLISYLTMYKLFNDVQNVFSLVLSCVMVNLHLLKKE